MGHAAVVKHSHVGACRLQRILSDRFSVQENAGIVQIEGDRMVQLCPVLHDLGTADGIVRHCQGIDLSVGVDLRVQNVSVLRPVLLLRLHQVVEQVHTVAFRKECRRIVAADVLVEV